TEGEVHVRRGHAAKRPQHEDAHGKQQRVVLPGSRGRQPLPARCGARRRYGTHGGGHYTVSFMSIETYRFLKVRSAPRLIVIFSFYGCLAMGLATWPLASEPVVQTRAYFAVMVIVGLLAITGAYLLRIAHCPRCREHFAVRRDGRARNNFTSQCLNCGL